MIEKFDNLFLQTRPAFDQGRTHARAHALAKSSLVSLGRHTITGMLCTGAQHDVDWSAAYRLFAHERFDADALFAPARKAAVQALPTQDYVVAAMDDTLLHKRGRKIAGASWKRDPLGPPFCTSFVWSQRFLQTSIALPESSGACRARAIPVDYKHAPVPKKPKKTANAELWTEYFKQQKMMRISLVGNQRMKLLRESLDNDGEKKRLLIMGVDGSLTNQTVLRDIPDRTVVIGRIRKDAKLFSPPPIISEKSRGRKKFYGEQLPTPEQMRQDSTMPWQTVTAWAAGKQHQFDIKTMNAVRWKGSGNRDVRLVIIRPLGYRPRIGAKILYRQPAYLLCTDPKISLERLLQSYLWRWEIELNFRDEKTVLGIGEAQVRTSAAVGAVPAFFVAAYSYLLLAAHDATTNIIKLPKPLWQKNIPEQRLSTPQLINMMRAQLWGKALGINKNHFVCDYTDTTKSLLFRNSLQTAVCLATG